MTTSEAMRRDDPAAASRPESQPVEAPADDRPVMESAVAKRMTDHETAPSERGSAPPRPSLGDKEGAPVIVKLPPPFFVRLSQIFWFLSLITGGVAIVYLFVIRLQQLPLITERVKAVDGTRADATYASAADIIFWSIFALCVAVVLLQILFQVSFSNRRPHARWWQFGSILFQAGVVLITRQLVALGDGGVVLERLLFIQLGLAALGLLVGLMPQALRWTAREYDVRRGPVAPSVETQL